MLLRLDEIEKRIGDRLLFRGVSFVVRAGDRIGVVGPNGAGKTTLLRMILGEEPLDGGQLQRARTTRLGMLRQEIDPRASHTVREEARTALAELDRLEAEIAELEAEMSRHGREGVFGEAAKRIMAGRGNRAVAHATQGPCLQQNLVCVLEGE